MRDPRTWSGAQALAAGAAVVVLALGAGVLVSKSSSGSSTAGAAGATGSPGATATSGGDPTAGPTTDDTGATPSGSPGPGGTASPGTSGTAPVAAGTPSPTRVRTPLPTYPASGRMVPPTLVSAQAAGCTAQTGGGWLAEFAVTFSGGSSWTVLPERGPVHGAGGQWTVGVETKVVATTSLALSEVQVGGGTPFTSVRLTVPGGPVAAACPS